ncbi:MAG: hypothetical protein RIS47_1210 [Bacteroidota bacterium]|jgi:hypothetical protein
MLPKFLIADNSQEAEDRLFVVHTQSPRCIIECAVDDFKGDQKIHWIDAKVEGKKLAQLLEDAEGFFEDELTSQDDLYDDEFGDED